MTCLWTQDYCRTHAAFLQRVCPAAQRAETEASVAALRETLREIVDLSAGWDEDGSTGPRRCKRAPRPEPRPEP